MKIVIDITDWHDEALRDEESAATAGELTGLVAEKGYNSSQLTRMHIVQRELGTAKNDVIPSNKALLHSGGVSAINDIFARARKEIEHKGKRFGVRILVAPIAEEEDEDGELPDTPTTWQVLGTEGALELAKRYLDRYVPGYVMGRLLIIRECGGDVRSAANALQDKIEQMVEDLT